MYRCISGFAYQWLCLQYLALPGGHLLCFLCAQSAPGMHSSAISEATCPLFDVHLKSHQQSPILALKTPSVTSVVDTTCSFDSTTWWVLRLYTLLHYYTTLVWWVCQCLVCFDCEKWCSEVCSWQVSRDCGSPVFLCLIRPDPFV